MPKKIFFTIISLLLLVILTACSTLEAIETGNTINSGTKDTVISGTFSALEINIASQIGGEVEQINFDLGDVVKKGEVILILNTDLINDQIHSAETAITSAQIALESALLGLDQANLNYQAISLEVRINERSFRELSWEMELPIEYELPVWYFTQEDLYQAAVFELNKAQDSLIIEQNNLQAELKQTSNANLITAEQRLAQAKEAFIIAEDLLNSANQTKENAALKDAAQEQFDSAQAELEAAQLHYEQILSTSEAEDVLEARARLAAAQKRVDLTQDRVDDLSTGEHNLSLQSAALIVDQAQLAITQAENALAQAKSSLTTLQTQKEKHTLYAPIDGVILSRTVEPGEILNPSATALVIGEIDTLTLKIYLPEDEYGKVNLGTQVTIFVDSYPGESFRGEVVYIADQAEYTPRNVQTVEGRHNTVYAVEIRVPNMDHKLKPGMPADVLLSSLQ